MQSDGLTTSGAHELLVLHRYLPTRTCTSAFGSEGEQQLVISAMPIVPNSPQSIHDEIVDEPDEIFTTLHEKGQTDIDDVEEDE